MNIAHDKSHILASGDIKHHAFFYHPVPCDAHRA